MFYKEEVYIKVSIELSIDHNMWSEVLHSAVTYHMSALSPQHWLVSAIVSANIANYCQYCLSVINTFSLLLASITSINHNYLDLFHKYFIKLHKLQC